jgi:hypothetical protein
MNYVVHAIRIQNILFLMDWESSPKRPPSWRPPPCGNHGGRHGGRHAAAMEAAMAAVWRFMADAIMRQPWLRALRLAWRLPAAALRPQPWRLPWLHVGRHAAAMAAALAAAATMAVAMAAAMSGALRPPWRPPWQQGLTVHHPKPWDGRGDFWDDLAAISPIILIRNMPA